jgi:hypothetical protein
MATWITGFPSMGTCKKYSLPRSRSIHQGTTSEDCSIGIQAMPGVFETVHQSLIQHAAAYIYEECTLFDHILNC